MFLYDLVLPIGIAAYSFLFITILLGLIKKIIKPKLRLRLHKIGAIITISLATIHAAIIIFTKLNIIIRI